MTCLFVPSSAHRDIIPVVKLPDGFRSWSGAPQQQVGCRAGTMGCAHVSLVPDPLNLSSFSCLYAQVSDRIHVHTA